MEGGVPIRGVNHQVYGSQANSLDTTESYVLCLHVPPFVVVVAARCQLTCGGVKHAPGRVSNGVNAATW